MFIVVYTCLTLKIKIIIIYTWLWISAVLSSAGDVSHGTGELDLFCSFRLCVLVRSATWEGQHATADEEGTPQTGDQHRHCRYQRHGPFSKEAFWAVYLLIFSFDTSRICPEWKCSLELKKITFLCWMIVKINIKSLVSCLFVRFGWVAFC